jgi:dTDP-4-dehydrorhamnose reductase
MILVTGASGLLGSNIMMHIQSQNEEAAAIYNSKLISFKNIQCIKANLTNNEEIKKIINLLEPDHIIHCAALTDVDRCEKYPSDAFKINTDATRFIAEAAYGINASLFYISTDSVFDGKNGDYQELDCPNPVNIYAKSKLQGESEIMKTGVKYCIARTNIHGWNLQDKFSLSEWILNKLETKQDVPAFCDVTFSPLLVNDLAIIILDMIENGSTGLYHIGSSEFCNKFEFACKLADVFNLDKSLIQSISIDDMSLIAKRPKNMSLNTTKIRTTLKREMPDIISGLKKFKLLRESGYAQDLKKHGEVI